MSRADYERHAVILAGQECCDPMVTVLATATPEEARAVWVALAQYIDNNDPECTGVDGKQWSDPATWESARLLQTKLDAATERSIDRAPVACLGSHGLRELDELQNGATALDERLSALDRELIEGDDDSDLIDEDPDDVLLGDDYVDCSCTFDGAAKTRHPPDPHCGDCDGKGRVELDMVQCSCTTKYIDCDPDPGCEYCKGTTVDPEFPGERCACAIREVDCEPKPDCGQCDGKGRRMWGQ